MDVLFPARKERPDFVRLTETQPLPKKFAAIRARDHPQSLTDDFIHPAVWTL